MKNNVFLIVLLAAIPACLFAQIPNSSFENWTINNGILEPDGWQISSMEGAVNVVRSDDSYDGTYSVEMNVIFDTVMGMTSGGFMFTLGNFPIDQRYQSLKGYIKGNVIGTDTMKIDVSVWRQGVMIGYVFFRNLVNHSGWTEFTAGIQYINGETPDAAFIAMQVGQGFGGNIGSWFRVDKLEFSNEPSGSTERDPVAFQTSPNPASDRIFIRRTPVDGISIFRLVNPHGRVVREAMFSTACGSVTLETGDLPNGLYLLREIRSDQAVYSKKIIIRHK